MKEITENNVKILITIIIILYVVKKVEETMSMIKRKIEDLHYIQMELPVIKNISELKKKIHWMN